MKKTTEQNTSKKRYARYTRSALVLCLSAGILTGCSNMRSSLLHEDSEISQTKFAVKHDHVIAHLPVQHADHKAYEALAQTYKLRGTGDIHIAMAYDSDTTIEQKTQLNQDIQRITKHFNDMGITQTKTSVVAVNKAQLGLSVIGFNTADLTSSTECKDKKIPGYHDQTRVKMDGYVLGCHSSDLMRRQVADQRDLMGKEGLGDRNDADRAANIVTNTYRPGEVQEYLPGFILSELGGSGE